MEFKLNAEIKAFCKDFAPVRELLARIGATFIEAKEQVDYFFNLPAAGDASSTKRLKLRIEKGESHLVYYYDSSELGSRTRRYQLWEMRDPQISEMLETALGVKVVVRKRRELWHKDNTIFNLDTVEGVGQVFEAEVQAADADDPIAQIREYRRLFGPFLGEDIPGSNEDLVLAANAGPLQARPRSW